ncbi:MAG: S-layer homology domain-containing protein [Nitrospirota bacterium]
MKKLIAISVSAILLLTLIANYAFAEIIPLPIPLTLDCTITHYCAVYVDDDAVGPGDGTEANPFTNITAAVDYVKAEADYNTIKIAEGTYSPTDTGEAYSWGFSDADSLGGNKVQIYGSYKNDFSVRDSDTYQTLIDMENSPVAIKLENVNAKIEGLTITGAGVFNWSSDGIVTANNTGATDYNVIINNNEFTMNSTTLSTPNLKVNLAGSNTAEIYENNFNTSTNQSSSIVRLTGDAEFYNNDFYKNAASSAIYCSEGANIYNNYFIGISANRIAYLDGGCTFVHNTVVDTTITLLTSEYAVVATDNDGNMVANNLITGTSGNATFHQFAGDSSTIEYNALFDNDEDPSPLTDNNLQCDPLYPGASHSSPSDIILGNGSECIDGGKTISSVSDDYFGNTRPEDGDGDGSVDYDPGAYEAPELIIVVPTVLTITNVGVTPDPFSPDADGTDDETTLTFTISDDADVTVNVEYDGDPTYVELLTDSAETAGDVTVVWDGMDSNGDSSEDGVYTFLIKVVGVSDTVTDSRNVEVDVDGDPVVVGQCAGYTDVLDTHPDCEAIEYMQSIDAMTGNPDGTFAPNDYLQRDQIAKISLETFELFDDSEDYCGGENPFPDVDSNDWAYQHICRGVELGMIYGYTGGADAGYYRPARDVNRVEFLALILRNVSDTMPDDSLGSYDDVEGGNWFSGYAKYSYDNALFDGNKLFPAQPTTRLEVARHVYELYLLGKI